MLQSWIKKIKDVEVIDVLLLNCGVSDYVVICRADVTSPLRQFQQSTGHELVNNVDDGDRRFSQESNTQVHMHIHIIDVKNVEIKVKKVKKR